MIIYIEKTENIEELRKTLQKLEKQVTKEEKDNLIRIIKVNLTQKIGEEKLEELIKEMKGEDEDMLGCVEMVWEEGMNKGKREGKKERNIEIAIEMKKNNIEVELIEKITGLTKKIIENIKI